MSGYRRSGAAVYVDEADVTIADALVTMNTLDIDAARTGLAARAQGAGIAAGGPSRLELRSGARVVSNTARAHAGGSGRTAHAQRGGLFLTGGTLVATAASIEDDEALAEGAAGNLEASGGGIHGERSNELSLSDTTLSDNRARTESTTSAFDAASGGGLAIAAGVATTVTLTRVTIATNEVDGGRDSRGGAVYATTAA